MCLQEASAVTISTTCLIPNPLSDKTFLRTWEIESQADKWTIPRAELSLGPELGHGYFGSVHRGVWREELEVAIKTLRDRHGREERGESYLQYYRSSSSFRSDLFPMIILFH